MAHHRKVSQQIRKCRKASGRGSRLFPEPTERVRFDDLLTRKLVRASERVAEGPVRPTLDFDSFRSELPISIFESRARSTNCCRGLSRGWRTVSFI